MSIIEDQWVALSPDGVISLAHSLYPFSLYYKDKEEGKLVVLISSHNYACLYNDKPKIVTEYYRFIGGVDGYCV